MYYDMTTGRTANQFYGVTKQYIFKVYGEDLDAIAAAFIEREKERGVNVNRGIDSVQMIDSSLITKIVEADLVDDNFKWRMVEQLSAANGEPMVFVPLPDIDKETVEMYRKVIEYCEGGMHYMSAIYLVTLFGTENAD